MGTAGHGNRIEGKPSRDSERSDPNIKNLPADATQPGGAPKRTEEAVDQKVSASRPSARMPPAGPHADPRLMNPDATPGTGLLAPPGGNGDVEASSG